MYRAAALVREASKGRLRRSVQDTELFFHQTFSSIRGGSRALQAELRAAACREPLPSSALLHSTFVPRLLSRRIQTEALGSRLSQNDVAADIMRTSLQGLSVASLVARVRHYARCYYELSKTKLSLLVMSTATAGFVMGSDESVDWALCGYTSLGTLLAAASANTFNQVMETRNDSLMKRTLSRPLPSGRISPLHALMWAVAAGVGGVVLLNEKTNPTAAALAAGNIVLYAALYTPLKQLSVANTWVGAVVGALPPLLGYAAASGGSLGPQAWPLAAALFFWQIPHFMALAWLCRVDYARGGYRMLSLIDPSGRRVAAAALRNSLYLVPVGFGAAAVGCTSPAFALENALLSAAMAAASFSFLRSPTNPNAKLLFRASLMYLPFAMAAMMLHRLPHKAQLQIEDATKADTEGIQMQEASSDETATEDEDDVSVQTRERGVMMHLDLRAVPHHSIHKHPLPPVAFYSAAPFPFLPAPHY